MKRPLAVVATSLALALALSAAGGAAETMLKSGIDSSGFDTSVRPQDNFFQYVNGGWIAHTEIPADKSNYGSFTALADKAESDLRAIIEEAAADKTHAKGSDAQKIGDMYASFMDTARIEKLGVTPLKAEFGRIDAIKDRPSLVRYLAHALRVSIKVPVNANVNQDAKDTTKLHHLLGPEWSWAAGSGLLPQAGRAVRGLPRGLSRLCEESAVARRA